MLHLPTRLAVGAIGLIFIMAACSSTASTSPSASEAQQSASPAPEESASEAPNAGPTMVDTSLGVEVVVDGLTEPTNLAFLGADDFFVTEKSTGHVIHVQDGVASEPVIDLAVNFFDERGLLGIALHPEFDSNGYVYLYWTASGQGTGQDNMLGEDTDEEAALPDLGNRVDRFVWDGAALTWDMNIAQLRSNTLVTDTLDRIRGNHDAGPIVFGQDGKLFIIVGDQNQRTQLQNLPDADAPDDINFTGVILRVNDDGSIPADNPFYQVGAEMGGEAGENVQSMWAYGIRNSFGMAIHPGTGDLWQTENGDDSWDEVNVFPAGSNSGWIQLMGPPERFDEYRQIETESEDGLDNPDWDPIDNLAQDVDGAMAAMLDLDGSQYVAPAFSWKHPVAVTSIGFVDGDALGDSSVNTAWLGSVLNDSLYRYPLANDGSGFDFADDPGLADLVDDNAEKGDLGESADYVVGTGFGVVTHILQAPDGPLYVSSISAGAVYRIAPAGEVGGNPAASASASSSAAAGEIVEISVSTDTGQAMAFDPVEVAVLAGATVRLTFTNAATVPHNLTFDDPINAATATVVAPGASEAIEFVAPDAGEYTFVCTLHPGMQGTLIVDDAG